MYTTLLHSLFILGTFAAPAALEPRANDRWSVDGYNCWGRADPSNTAQIQWTIHIDKIDPNHWSEGGFKKQLGKHDAAISKFKANFNNGELAIAFSSGIGATPTQVRKSFQAAAGNIDPGCHNYGRSAPVAIDKVMDDVSHVA